MAHSVEDEQQITEVNLLMYDSMASLFLLRALGGEFE